MTESGKGAVYVYHGSKDGISTKYRQVTLQNQIMSLQLSISIIETKIFSCTDQGHHFFNKKCLTTFLYD